MKSKILAFCNGLALLGVLVVNWAANRLPLNGQSTAQISDKYANLFTPAGITFAIWGVIYLLLIIFVIYQFKLAFGTKQEQRTVEAVGVWFIISSVLNAAWLFAWHYNAMGLAMVIMVGILASLVGIYISLHSLGKVSSGVKNFVKTPFSVYLGWISVATIANAAILLTKVGWNGWGIEPAVWTVVVLCVGLALALAMIIKYADYGYAAVILWAYFGIILKRIEDSTQADLGVIVTAGLSMATIILVILWRLIQPKNSSN